MKKVKKKKATNKAKLHKSLSRYIEIKAQLDELEDDLELHKEKINIVKKNGACKNIL